MKLRLLAGLTLLKGLSYVNAATSAFLVAAFTWVHRPYLLLVAAVFLGAAVGCALIYQRMIQESLKTLIKALPQVGRANPEIARSAAQLLYLEGRDDEARKLLIEYFGETPFVD